MISILNPNQRQASPSLELGSHPYRRHVFTTPNVSDPNSNALTFTPIQYTANGDSLYINRVTGAGIIQIRFGKNNSWITVTEGTILRCNFTEFWVRDAENYYPNFVPGIPAFVEIFSSYEKDFNMIRPYKSLGVKAGQLFNSALLVHGSWHRLEDLISTNIGLQVNNFIGGNVIGGNLLIKSRATNTDFVQLTWGVLQPPALKINSDGSPFGYVLDPGESISIQYESKFGFYISPDLIGGNGPVVGISLACFVSDCTLCLSYTPNIDLSDSDYFYNGINKPISIANGAQTNNPLDMGG